MEIHEGMAKQGSYGAPVTFHDFAARFSKEEWKLLREWQTELYKNVMKELQQAVTSLGPLIATCVFSLRPEKKEDLFPEDDQDLQTRGNINSFRGFPFPKPHTGLRKEREFESSLKDHHATELRGRSTNPSSKGQWETGQAAAQLNKWPIAEKAVNITIPSFKIKEEGETYFVDYHDSESRESINSPTEDDDVTQVVSFIVKDEMTHSMDLQESEAGGSINTLTGGHKSVNITKQQQTRSCHRKNTQSEFGISYSQNLDSGNQKRIHAEVKAYACPEYDSSFNQRPNIVKHERTQRAQKAHTSTDYGESFSDSLTPIQHQEIPTGLKSCICSQCGNFFDQSTITANQHQQLINGKQQSICSECETSYQSTHLNKGTAKPAREKSFICNECRKMFKTAPTLRRHQRIHTGEKPYTCSECGRSFRRSEALVIHQRLHTGEKPYTCGQCGKHFRQMPHLIKHQRMHMGKKVAPKTSTLGKKAT